MRLLVLGTGGMANTHAEHFAAIDGVELVGAVDVDPARAKAFAAQDFDIVINATSVGFKQPDSNPLDGRLASHLIVMDVAFMPAHTALLLQAAALGCRTVSGTRMLVHQACRQIELYTGMEAPIDIMEQAMLEEIHRLKL